MVNPQEEEIKERLMRGETFIEIGRALTIGRKKVSRIAQSIGFVPTHKQTLVERLEKKLKPSGTCLLWTGNVDGGGYGVITHKGTIYKTHRLAWSEHYKQPIPLGMYVCHTCDNKRCCNPEHLFIGTPRDNALDMVAKGRHGLQNGKGVRTGEANPSAVLTAEAVEAIRVLHNLSWSKEKLARAFSISASQIRNITSKKHWKNT